MAPSLPMQMNQNMTMMSVMANGPAVVINAIYSYDREYLNFVSRLTGISLQAMREHVENYAPQAIGSGDARLVAFIGLGGRVIYDYHFSDGERYLEVIIDHCS